MTSVPTLTVYLGSSGHARPVFREAALTLGRAIGARNYKLVYGGMDAGLMGLLAMAALESGAHVTGIVPERLKDSERMLHSLSETLLVGDLWERKEKMFRRADAVIALPGGFGTLDESLEVLYWGRLGLHGKPLILVNVEGYWDDAIRYLRGLPDFDPRYLIVVPDVEGVFAAFAQHQTVPHDGACERLPHFEDEISRADAGHIVIAKPSIENTYYAACALGLKQLAKHQRPIGFVNTGGQFDGLLAWIARAAEESFITQNCLRMFDAAPDEKTLLEKLKAQKPVSIDLHRDKWGERRQTGRGN